MESLFLKLLNMSLTASYLIVAVIILRLILKSSPKWVRLLLWGLVGIRLICPISPKSILSIIPSAEPIPQNITTSPSPEINTGIDILNNTVNPIISQSLAPEAGASVNPTQIIVFISSLIWLVGIATIILYSIISYVRLRRKVKVSLPLEDNIYLCDNIDTPFILGILKAKIFIPSSADREQMPYVISHERAHLKHLDHILKPFGFVLLTVYWFNPLVWIAYSLFCRDIEFACDERVIKSMEVKDKKEYSNALLSLSVSRKILIAHPLAFGEVGVKSRIKSVLNYKKPTFWVVITAVILAIAVGIFFLTDPKVSDGEPYIPTKSSTNCEGVTVSISGIDTSSESPYIEIQWENETGKDIAYGEQFSLYRIENNRKINCDTLNERYWNSLLNLLQGEYDTHIYSISGFDISKEGKYLLEFNFTIGNEEYDKYTASVEFNIADNETSSNDAEKTSDASRVNETLSTSNANIVSKGDYYSVYLKNYLYSYTIFDKKGNTLVSDTSTRHPHIEMVSDSIAKLSIQSGTGISTKTTTYYNVKNGLTSPDYHSVFDENESNIIRADYSDGKHCIIIQSIFSYGSYYKYIPLEDAAEATDPVMNASFSTDGQTAAVTYETADNYKEKTITVSLF